jgi:hypothetical protein
VDVGADAALGSQITRHHLGRVVGAVADLAEIRVGLVGRVAVVAVVGALAAVEVLVDTRAGEAVEPFDGRQEVRLGQAGLLGQFLDGAWR